MTTALVLARQGRSVLVVDEGPIGGGQTNRTSAHLASINDDRFYEIEKKHDAKTAALSYQSHSAAIDWIENFVKDESVECDFRRVDAFLFRGAEDKTDSLENEFDAARRAGVEDMSWVDSPGDGAKTGRAIRFGGQAIFQPAVYLRGLAAAAERAGVIFRIGDRVTDVSGRIKDTPPTVSFASGLKLECEWAVVATNVPTPINDWVSIYLKQAAYRTYVVGLAVDDFAVPDALFWDTADPYHYVRLHQVQGQSVLLVGGADHKVGQMKNIADPFADLTRWAKTVFPSAGREISRWSGEVQEPSDGLGVIGVAPTKGNNVYVITGDSGMGLTHGTLGALLIADLIAGKENPWTAVYDPSRHLMNGQAIKEDLNANLQYADYLTSGDIHSPADLRRGEGGLMRSGLKKIAVYKDPDGAVHQCSAVCPHLAALVQWNPIEKTWDCPAHGSHFDCRGKLLIGPSVDDLPPLD